MKPLTYLLIDFENLQPPAEDISLVRGEDYRLWIFHGPHQNKFAAEMVVAWQPLGKHVHFVQSSKPGKNALDFHIAFSLGRLHLQNGTERRSARYIVVSNDSGFDSLFDHMRKLGCAVGKTGSIAEALGLAESIMPDATVRSDGRLGLETPQVANAQPSGVAVPLAPSPAVDAGAEAKAPTGDRTTPKKVVAALRRSMTAEDVDKVIADLRTHAKNRPTDRKALEHHIVSVLRNKVAIQVSHAVIKELERRAIVLFAGKKIEYKIPKAKKRPK